MSEKDLQAKLEKVEETLEAILKENEDSKKRIKFQGQIRLGLTAVLLIILFVFLSLFVQAYKYFTSQQFLNEIKNDVAPTVINQVGTKAQEIAPEVIDLVQDRAEEMIPSLLGQIEGQLPAIIDKFKQEATLFVEATVNETRAEIESIIQESEFKIADYITQNSNEMYDTTQENLDALHLDATQMEELKTELFAHVDTRINETTITEMQGYLEGCIYSGEKIYGAVQGFQNVDENQRVQYGYDILQSFLNFMTDLNASGANSDIMP